jgi:hypothetical protein
MPVQTATGYRNTHAENVGMMRRYFYSLVVKRQISFSIDTVN